MVSRDTVATQISSRRWKEEKLRTRLSACYFTYSFETLIVCQAVEARAAVFFSAAAATILNNFGAAAVRISASAEDSLMPAESSKVDVDDPFKTLFNVRVTNMFVWPTSRASSTSTTVWCLIKISSRLDVELVNGSQQQVSTFLRPLVSEKKLFPAGQCFTAKLDIVLRCSQPHWAPACSIASIKRSAHAWVVFSQPCGQLSYWSSSLSLFSLEPRIWWAVPDFFLDLLAVSLDCVYRVPLRFKFVFSNVRTISAIHQDFYVGRPICSTAVLDNRLYLKIHEVLV